MSATVTMKNDTGGLIKFTNINPTNDDAEWGVNPPAPEAVAQGASVLVSMGNESAPFPKGVGFNSNFFDSAMNVGALNFDDPAVGKHSFATSGPFNFVYTNSGDNYYVTITAK